MFGMRRREFVALLGGAAVAWPLAARAQQPERMRRIGVLTNLVADDPEAQARIGAFLQGLQELGWTDRPQHADRISLGGGRCRPNPQIRGGIGRARAGCHPDQWGQRPGAFAASDPHVPIVFAQVPDPVGAGFVNSLARPGGNATGFIHVSNTA